MTTVLVYCDRCKKRVADAYRNGAMTAGFYDVGMHPHSQWVKYAREGERNVCGSLLPFM